MGHTLGDMRWRCGRKVGGGGRGGRGGGGVVS